MVRKSGHLHTLPIQPLWYAQVCTQPDRDEHPLAAVASLKGYEEASELLFEAIRISAAGCCLFLMIFDNSAVAPCH